MWVAKNSQAVYILLSNGSFKYMYKNCGLCTGNSFVDSDIQDAHMTMGADGNLYVAYTKKYSESIYFARYVTNGCYWYTISDWDYSNGVCTSIDQIAEDILLR